jgi:shikimate kinase
MKVVLLGYMGCGKSVIGAFLSEKLHVPFYDLDHEIEELTHKSIVELFQTKGEIYFRKVENEVLKSILEKKETFVLSLGGGTPCYYNNHELLQQHDVTSFYLKASVANLVARLSSETAKRPILSGFNATELTDFINKHLFDRNFYYHQASKVVSVDDKSIAEISDEIIEKLA